MYLFPLIDVKAVILQFLLQNIGDVNVNVDDLLLTFPLNINVWLNPLKETRCEPSGKKSTETKKMWFSLVRQLMSKMKTEVINLTILLISSEKVLSPLFEDSGSESSPSLLSEDEIKPRDTRRD